MCTKICRTCKEEKELAEFPWQEKYGFRGTSGTWRLDCKVCTAAKARAYRQTYVSKGNVIRKDVDTLLYQACSIRVTDAKGRSAKVGCEFDIDKNYMYDLIIHQNKLCALSGVELEIRKNTPHTLSIDKVDPNKGYIKGNVQWVSWAVNRAKGDLSHKDFIRMCKAIVRCNDYP